MKRKIGISLATIVVLGSMAYAGGNIAPVEPVEAAAPVVIEKSGFYGGIGYGYFDQEVDGFNVNGITSIEYESDSVLLQLGYRYNNYLAFEGRYWIGVGDIDQSGGVSAGSYSGDFDAWGLYVKPIYPVTEELDIYALLGYSSTSVEQGDGSYWDTDSFSWGLGAQYAINEHFSLFVDYVNLGMPDSFDLVGVQNDIDADIDLYTVNVGVTYSF